MELKFSVMWTILLYHILCCNLMMSPTVGIVGKTETLKDVEYFEIEQKLELINKPADTIIKTIYGEEYGCVDFYKQPALNHPSMKNHAFHYNMNMTSYPKGSKMQREKSSKKTFSHFWENGVGCPIGTVPILRVTRDDLLRWKSFNGDSSDPRGSWNVTDEPPSFANGGGYHFAVVRTKKGSQIYNGASMNLNIYTPPVKQNQRSSARLHFQFGDEFIQAGWSVHPRLFGDDKSRLFVYTRAGGHACYHTQCPDGFGMILLRQDFAPGFYLRDKYADIDIAILKDSTNKNWNLYVDGQEIGYWPSDRFKMSSGTGVEWGGAVYAANLPSPPMGCGRFPTGSPLLDSYVRQIAIVDGNYVTDKTVSNVERYADNTRGYVVRDAEQSWWKHMGHIVIYGGPGNI